MPAQPPLPTQRPLAASLAIPAALLLVISLALAIHLATADRPNVTPTVISSPASGTGQADSFTPVEEDTSRYYGPSAALDGVAPSRSQLQEVGG